MGVPAHQATTRHLGAAYPFASEAGLGGRGVLIGRDLLGGAFVYDPFELYNAGALTNPNMVVFGQIGRGTRHRADRGRRPTRSPDGGRSCSPRWPPPVWAGR